MPPKPIIERWSITVRVDAHIEFVNGGGPRTEDQALQMARRFAARYGQRLWKETGASEVEAEVTRATTGSADLGHAFDLLFDLPERCEHWRKFFEQVPEIASMWAEDDIKRNEDAVDSVSVQVWRASHIRHGEDGVDRRGIRVPVAPPGDASRDQMQSKNAIASRVGEYVSRIWTMLAVAFLAGVATVIVAQRLLPESAALDRIERIETILMARPTPAPTPNASDLTVNCPPTRVTVRPARNP